MNLAVSLALAVASVAGWPLAPRPAVVHPFEPPAQSWLSGHRGVDLAGTPGQAVLAAQDGIVTYAGSIAGRGVVVVSHGSYRTTYQPVVATVTRGSTVSAGDRIGTLALLGSHCLPNACLHWGLVRGEEYLDPLSLVGQDGPVRLFPTASGPASGGTPPAQRPLGPAPEVSAFLTFLGELAGRFAPSDPLTPADEPAGRPSVGGRW